MTQDTPAVDDPPAVEVSLLRERSHTAWHELVAVSPNGTCFHELAFLDYHPPGRHEWHHLLFGNPGVPEAVLPAAIVAWPDGTKALQSPTGATLGGFALRPHLGLQRTMQIVSALIGHARELGLGAIDLGTVPTIYWRSADDRLEFALQNAGFHCTRQLMYYVDLKRLPEADVIFGLPGRERAGFRKAFRQGLTFGVADTPPRIAEFHEVLCANKALHGTVPVHNLEDLLRLKERLGLRMTIYTATLDKKIVAGVYCIRVTSDASYAQYIADRPEYRGLDATRYVLCETLRALREDGVSRLDLGPSLRLPVGPIGGARFKESLGAVGCERRQWQLRLQS